MIVNKLKTVLIVISYSITTLCPNAQCSEEKIENLNRYQVAIQQEEEGLHHQAAHSYDLALGGKKPVKTLDVDAESSQTVITPINVLHIDSQERKHGSGYFEDDVKNPILDYLVEQGDSISNRPIKLGEIKKPIIIDDHSHLCFENGSFKIPMIENSDRKLHYLLGSTNEKVFQKTGIGNINFLILVLDAIVFESTDSGLRLKRISKPIFYDRKSSQLTLNKEEYAIFLSANGKKNKQDHEKIINLSKNRSFDVQDVQKNTSSLYFYPFNISINPKAQAFMNERFKDARGLKNNYDSEIHATYALVNTSNLIRSFFNEIKNQYKGIDSFGLRYYSFLDICGRCQEFLVDSQLILKPLFMEAFNQAFETNKPTTSTPFIVVGHSDRIYRRNQYNSTSGDITHYSKIKGYTHATSGPKVGEFITDSLIKYGGGLIASSTNVNQLIMVIDEPDLGDQNQEGIVRHAFTHLNEAQFSEYGLTDQQGSALAAKLTRADPIKIEKANFSKNHFGIVIPDFLDDPVTVTSGQEIISIFNYLSQCVNLQELHFSKVHLSAFNPFNSLCEVLPKFTKLQVLDVSNCKIDHENISLLLGAISNLQTLNEFNISRNFIYSEGLEELNELLPNLINLRKLSLAYSALCHCDGRERYDDPFEVIYDNSAFINFAKVIKNCVSITSLDISHYTVHIEKEDVAKFKKIAQRLGLEIFTTRKKFH